jgi:diacylglycerol kinase (ATP)
MSCHRVLVIVNKHARRGDVDLQHVQKSLQEAGLQVTTKACDDADQACTAISRYHGEVDCIAAGGGDGTLHGIVEAVLESGLPLGLLPMGTANDLAHTLQIPDRLQAAVQVIAAGRITRIDLGWVNGKHYFNVANIGLGFHISRVLTAAMKKRWGVLAYPLSLWRAYTANRPFKARIVCDGRAQRLSSMQIAVGNGRHYGGVMTVHQDAAIDDHHLDLYSIKPRSLWSLLQAAPTIVRGTFMGDNQILLMHGQHIEVQTNRTLSVSTDGEFTTRTPAQFRVAKDALPVIVP